MQWTVVLFGGAAALRRCGAAALGIAVYRINIHRLMARYGDAFRAYNVRHSPL